VEAERDAIRRLGAVVEIGGAQGADREARARAVQTDAAGSVEQPELGLTTKREDAIRGVRHEAFHPDIGVAQHLEQLRATAIVARGMVVEARKRLQKGEHGD